MTDFDGITYEPARDRERLSSQLGRVEEYLADHDWHTLGEITEAVGGTEASISARLRDLRKPKFGAYIVERRHVEGGLWEYRMLDRDPKPQPVVKVSLDPAAYVSPSRSPISREAFLRMGGWQCTNCSAVSSVEPPLATLDPKYRRGRCGSCQKNTQHLRLP